MVSRRKARECVLQGLYAHAMGGGGRDHVIEMVIRPLLSNGGDIRGFAERLFADSLDTATIADELIERHADNWALGRMALLDRLILRMAVCELVRFPDIPPKVTINEAIDIAKCFSTERSGHFINGVLDALVHQLLREGQIRKSGRGLVGMKSLKARH